MYHENEKKIFKKFLHTGRKSLNCLEYNIGLIRIEKYVNKKTKKHASQNYVIT
jgi:hypothetical protein